MHDPSDLESAIERSLESRSARLGASSGNLDDVFNRVQRRRSRRRGVAAVGSVAAVGVGVLGIVALADRRDTSPTSSPDPESSAAAVDATVPARAAWRCHDQLDYWGETGDEVYFASCEQTTIDSSFEVLEPPAPSTPSETTTTTTVASTEVIGALPSIPPATVASDPRVSPIEQLYVVIAGDSLIEIAGMFGVDLDVLVAYNEWPEGVGHPIYPGDVIRVPPGAIVPDGLDTRTGPDSTTTTTTTPTASTNVD